MLVINPEECIDCALCEPECPVDAIKSSEDLGDKEDEVLELNKELSAIWPNIVEKCDPCEDADNWSSVQDKLKYLER
jgi:ferredoxin